MQIHLQKDSTLEEVRGQKSEVRSQRSEVRGQRTEVRSQRSEDRGQKSEVRSQKSEVRGQRSEVRSQRTEVRGQRSVHLQKDSTLEWKFDALPGGELVHKGLDDLSNGRRTVASLLVLVGGPRLRALGITAPASEPHPEHALYDFLAQEDPDSAHSSYNALIRRLVSFERAAECVAR